MKKTYKITLPKGARVHTIDTKEDEIVFVPSKEEDSDRITCGNALIANKQAKELL